MKSLLEFILFFAGLMNSFAFVVQPNVHVVTPPVTIATPQVTNIIDNSNIAALSNSRPTSFNDYISSSIDSSSTQVSLVERKPPTPEEIAAKKRNFNLWFWGGGIVAPFLSTVYYFGLKFWQR